MNLTYLDNNATTRPAPEVTEGMLPFLGEAFGNPSSGHVLGQRAAFAVNEARRSVAACLGADPDEIVFTSGGTESDNLAIRGALGLSEDRRHVVTTAVEHEAVLRLVEQLQREGYGVTIVRVGPDGRLDLDQLRDSIREDTAVVSVMAANNETGVLFPLPQISAICRDKNVLLHTDAVQAVGKVTIDVNAVGVDMLSLSAHKFHGPKGIGALYIRRPLQIPAQIIGGFQERDTRGGTENVPGIVGLGIAARLAQQHGDQAHARMRALRDHMEQAITDRVRGAQVIGAESERLPNTSLIAFEGLKSEQVLIGLSECGICASGGSACHSGSLEPSGVLQAMGIDRKLALGTVRLSVCRYTTDDDVARTTEAVSQVMDRLAALRS